MITCNKNNFGSPNITFVDYQTPELAILNGRFSIDTQNPEYQAAQRLEIPLPPDFIFEKSAISTAFLLSNQKPASYGTVLRCWIEKKTLCIEKLTAWDEHGPLDIIISAGFVTRGYRGEFQQLTRLRVTDSSGSQPYAQGGVLTDDFVYLAVAFERFPSSNSGPTAYSIRIGGLPEDIDLDVAIGNASGVYSRDDIGSVLFTGRIQRGMIHFRFGRGASNLGGNSTFISFFAPRHRFSPHPQVAGNLILNVGDVKEDSFSTVESLSCRVIDDFYTIDAKMSRPYNYYEYDQGFDLNRPIDEIPDSLVLPMLSRCSADRGYRTCLNEVMFNRYFKTVELLHHETRVDGHSIELFGSAPLVLNA